MLQQGTPEWRQARCGSIGSSDMPRVVRKVKSGGYSADRAQLLAEKVMERMTATPFERFKSAAMLQGSEREPLARMTYELIHGVIINQVGLIIHPRIEGAHASPDGLIDLDGMVEIKSPLPAAHLDTLTNETVEADYCVQVQWQLACAGRAWCDFVSYHPDFPPTMRLWVKRLRRDDGYIAELEREAKRFIRELEDKIDKLARRYPTAA